MKTLKKIWDNLETCLVVVIFVMMLVSLTIQVVARFVFSHGTAWSEELGRYLMIWLVFIATALASDSHVRVDMFIKVWPKALRKYALLVGDVIWLAFVVMLTVRGIPYVAGIFAQHQIGYTVPFGLGWVYLSIPLGFGLLAIHILEKIIRTIINWNKPPEETTSEK